MKINFKKLFKPASCCLALFFCFSSAKYFCVWPAIKENSIIYSEIKNKINKIEYQYPKDFEKIKYIKKMIKCYKKKRLSASTTGEIKNISYKILLWEKTLRYFNKKERKNIKNKVLQYGNI